VVAIDAFIRPMPMPAKPPLGILLSHPANHVATIGAMHPGVMSAMMRQRTRLKFSRQEWQ
jgi:hypothetical protein